MDSLSLDSAVLSGWIAASSHGPPHANLLQVALHNKQMPSQSTSMVAAQTIGVCWGGVRSSFLWQPHSVGYKTHSQAPLLSSESIRISAPTKGCCLQHSSCCAAISSMYHLDYHSSSKRIWRQPCLLSAGNGVVLQTRHTEVTQ